MRGFRQSDILSAKTDDRKFEDTLLFITQNQLIILQNNLYLYEIWYLHCGIKAKAVCMFRLFGYWKANLTSGGIAELRNFI